MIIRALSNLGLAGINAGAQGQRPGAIQFIAPGVGRDRARLAKPSWTCRTA